MQQPRCLLTAGGVVSKGLLNLFLQHTDALCFSSCNGKATEVCLNRCAFQMRGICLNPQPCVILLNERNSLETIRIAFCVQAGVRHPAVSLGAACVVCI